MAKLACRLTLVSDSPHTHQVITGFLMLHREGLIDLEVRVAPDRAAFCPTPHLVEATLNGTVRIAYDVLDGYNFPSGAVPLEAYLAETDLYFKRSYDADRHRDLANGWRIRPLGLNYHVVIGDATFRRLEGTTLAQTIRYMQRLLSGYYRTYGVQGFEDVPRHASDPTILFFARAWDPGGDRGEPGAPAPEEARERSTINSMRAECLRLLRREFGSRFVGGFLPSDYARASYPDCVLDDSVTRKATYMALVKRSDICVASMGLHGSNGWKLAEYVAASKAIVAERLRYAVPGDFCAGQNYSPFDHPEECVEKVGELVANEEKGYEMKVNNYRYYHGYVRPNRLVLNTLTVALASGQAQKAG